MVIDSAYIACTGLHHFERCPANRVRWSASGKTFFGHDPGEAEICDSNTSTVDKDIRLLRLIISKSKKQHVASHSFNISMCDTARVQIIKSGCDHRKLKEDAR